MVEVVSQEELAEVLREALSAHDCADCRAAYEQAAETLGWD